MTSRFVHRAVRVLVLIVLAAPVFIGIVYNSALIESVVNLPQRLVDEADNLRQGRVSEAFAVGLCITAMAMAWLRIIWVACLVVIGHWRGRDIPALHRPLARILLRVLLLAPVTMTIASPRVTAFPGPTLIDAGTGVESRSTARVVLLVSIAAAVGVSWRLHQRRTAAMRTDGVAQIEPETTEFESDVVRHGHDVAFERLEMAVRSLVTVEDCDFRWIVQHASGLIHVECSASHTHSPPWTRVTDTVHVLDAQVHPTDSYCNEEMEQVRMPIMLPVGTTDAGDIWVNLERVGSFSVIGSDRAADDVWEGLCQSLALSPLHMSVNLIGAEPHALFGRRQLVAADAVMAREVAAVLHCDESPSVLLEARGDRRSLIVSGTRSVRDRSSVECGLVRRGETWLLQPMQRPIRPTMCRSEDRSAMARLLGSSSDVVHCRRREQSRAGEDAHPRVREIMSKASFIVRVMGRPCIDHVRHGEVAFERSRSEELVVWLSLHPDRRRRSAARAEMWNVPVKDSTFSNVTSDVRRSLTVHERLPDGEQWLSVTLTDDLPLHPRIVTDVGILEECLDHARRHPEDGGPEVLAFGLEFVRGSPLESSKYLWRDTTGLSTGCAMLIVRAASLCAEMALERGDIESLYWSTAQGLRAVPGHEGLVSLRMRQHAENGDQASLSAEWEAHCRSLMNDDWGDARPSPKMVDLWSSLRQADGDDT